MRPRKRIVLCGRAADELHMLAYILRIRQPLAVNVVSRAARVRTFLEEDERQESARLVVYVHQRSSPLSATAARREIRELDSMRKFCQVPLLIWDQSGTLPPIHGLQVLPKSADMECFIGTVKQSMAVWSTGPKAAGLPRRIA